MLTPAQAKLLDAIIAHQVAHGGASPSFRELAGAAGLASISRVGETLAALQERGFVRRLPNKARAIEVLKRADGSAPQADRWASFQDADLLDLRELLHGATHPKRGVASWWYRQVCAAIDARPSLILRKGAA